MVINFVAETTSGLIKVEFTSPEGAHKITVHSEETAAGHGDQLEQTPLQCGGRRQARYDEL